MAAAKDSPEKKERKLLLLLLLLLLLPEQKGAQLLEEGRVPPMFCVASALWLTWKKRTRGS